MKAKRKALVDEGGFTLIELIVIISILAIISSLAIPNIMGATDRARRTTDIANARTIATSVTRIFAVGTNFTVSGVTDTNGNAKILLDSVGSVGDFRNEVANSLSGRLPSVQFIQGANFYIEFINYRMEIGVTTVDNQDNIDSTQSHTTVLFPKPSGEYAD